MNNLNRNLAVRFLQGNTSRMEESELLKAISSDPSLLKECRELEAEMMKEAVPSEEQKRSFASMISKMRRTHVRKSIYRSVPYVAVAAVVLAFVLLLRGSGTVRPDTETIRIGTGIGERKKYTLPDNTVVWLNSATVLEYSGDFQNRREVILSGEAYFNVTGNPRKPFVVKAGDARIKVLGTKFNLAAYEGERMLQASLVEGRIQFENEDTKMDMVPGEVLTYRSNSIMKCKEDVSNYISWMDGKLVYDSIILSDLLARLSSRYGIQIVYSPMKYADYTFKISLNTDEEIDAILDAVSILTPITWTSSGDTIFVKEI